MKIIACNVCKKPVEIADLFKVQLSSCNRTFDIGNDFDVCPNCVGVVKQTIESSLMTLHSVACSGKVTVTTVELPEKFSVNESYKEAFKPVEEDVKEIEGIPAGRGNYKKSVIDEDDFNQINKMFLDDVEPREISKKLRILVPIVRAVIDSSDWKSYQKSLISNESDSLPAPKGKTAKAVTKKRIVSSDMYSKVKDLQSTNFSIASASKYTKLAESTIETIYACNNRREYLLTILDINKIKELVDKGYDNIEIAKEMGCTWEDISIVLF